MSEFHETERVGSPLQQACLTPADWANLEAAVESLETQSLASAISGALGKHVRAAVVFAPEKMRESVAEAVNLALRAALRGAIASLSGRAIPPRGPVSSSIYVHRAAVALTGAAGGAFGLAMLPFELPVSTTLMLRGIADIARSEGEDLSSPEAALACIEVFALGGGSDEGAWDSGYFAVRAFLAKAVGAATVYLAGRSIVEETAPALMRLVSLVATRFGASVAQKIAVQAVPVLGAAGGGAVNYVFMEHFQRMAKAHFVIRRLERAYGPAVVREAFERISLARAGNRAKPVPAGQS